MESKIKSMRLPRDLIEKLDRESIAEQRSFSQMVKVILTKHFEQKERPQRAPIQGYLGINNSKHAQEALDRMQIEQNKLKENKQ